MVPQNYFLKKLRDKGLQFCTKRVVEVFKHLRRTLQPEKLISQYEKGIRDRVKVHLAEAYNNKRILAIYDFIDLPHSYDIATFLVNAEIERRQKNCEKIDVAFMCHASDPGTPRMPYVNTANFRHYVHNLALEITRLFDHVGSILVFDNRKLFLDFYTVTKNKYVVFPNDYNPKCPIELGQDHPPVHAVINMADAVREDSTLLALRAPEEQIRLARKWLNKNIWPKIPITITLREWDSFSPGRNSNHDAWSKIVKEYIKQDIHFIILRDYYKIYEEDVLTGPNLTYCNEAVLSVPLRAAIYQESSLNLFVTNGCATLGQFNKDVNYLIFDYGKEERTSAPAHVKADQGLEWGDNFHGASPYQKIVWGPDSFEVIKAELNLILNKLKADSRLVPQFYRDNEQTFKPGEK